MVTKEQYDEACKTIKLYREQLESQSFHATIMEKFGTLDVLDRPINYFDLSHRIINCLNRHYYNHVSTEGKATFGYLLSLSKTDVLKVSGLSSKSMYEIADFLHGIGLWFGANKSYTKATSLCN